MDLEEPTNRLNYVDILSEFQDLGIEDVVHLNSLNVAHLATFGTLGMDGARCLHKYAQDKLLAPLGLLETGLGEGPSAQEVASGGGGLGAAPAQATVEATHWQDIIEDEGRLIKEESYEVILEWLDGVQGCELENIKEEEEEEEEVDELESVDESGDSDMATSQSQEI
jgi:hypothetical protein